MLAYLFTATNADVITGVPVTPRKASLIEWVLSQEYEQRFIDIGENYIDCAATTCMAVKKKVLEKVRFDESISTKQALGEDFAFSFNLIKKGYKIIFVPTAKFWHKRRGAVGGKFTPFNLFFETRNSILYVRKNLMNLNKFEQFLSFLYLGLIDFPINLLKCFLSSKKIGACMKAAIKGLTWHLNRNSVPSDSQMAKLLSKG